MKDANRINLFFCSAYPATYTSGSFTILNEGLLAGYAEQRLILFASTFFSFHGNIFPLLVHGLFFLSLWFYVCTHKCKSSFFYVYTGTEVS